MGVREDLVAAKALIDTPEKWGKGSYRDENGCYCVLGAVSAAMQLNCDDDVFSTDAIDVLISAVGGDVVDFNDDEKTTHADIMALFDRAIASVQP